MFYQIHTRTEAKLLQEAKVNSFIKPKENSKENEFMKEEEKQFIPIHCKSISVWGKVKTGLILASATVL